MRTFPLYQQSPDGPRGFCVVRIIGVYGGFNGKGNGNGRPVRSPDRYNDKPAGTEPGRYNGKSKDGTTTEAKTTASAKPLVRDSYLAPLLAGILSCICASWLGGRVSAPAAEQSWAVTTAKARATARAMATATAGRYGARAATTATAGRYGARAATTATAGRYGARPLQRQRQRQLRRLAGYNSNWLRSSSSRMSARRMRT